MNTEDPVFSQEAPVDFPMPMKDARSIVSPAGVLKKLYVSRERAARLQPCIVVETVSTFEGKADILQYARNVKWVASPDDRTEFKWSGNHKDAPALWVETTAELVLEL